MCLYMHLDIQMHYVEVVEDLQCWQQLREVPHNNTLRQFIVFQESLHKFTIRDTREINKLMV